MENHKPKCDGCAIQPPYEVYLSVEYQGKEFVESLLTVAVKVVKQRQEKCEKFFGSCIKISDMCFCQNFSSYNFGKELNVSKALSACICDVCAKSNEEVCSPIHCSCEECRENAVTHCTFEECTCSICPKNLEVPCSSDECPCRFCPEAEVFVSSIDLSEPVICHKTTCHKPPMQPIKCQYAHFYEELFSVYVEQSNVSNIKCECDPCVCYDVSTPSSSEECFCVYCVKEDKGLVHSSMGNEDVNIQKDIFIWPIIENFNIEEMQRQIIILCNIWSLPSPWKFYVEYLEKREDKIKVTHVFEASFFYDTLQYPVPQATASVYFYVEYDFLVPPFVPVGISYKFEGTRLIYKPFDDIRHEVWLTRTLNAKINFFRSINI